MLAPLVAVGLTLWLLNQSEKKNPPKPKPEEPKPSPGGIPTPNPSPTVKYTWSGEYAVSGPGGENVVWSFDTGVNQYWVIGNKTHTSFLSANSDRGTFTIPKEATGNERDSKRVVAFPGLEAASAKADEMSNPPPRDPNDPTQPQPQPEDEEEEKDDGGFGGLPAAPGYQLGQGMGSFSM